MGWSPQGESEKGSRKAFPEVALEVQERLECVWELGQQISALEGNLQAWLSRAGAGQPLCMRVEHDQVIPRNKARHVRPVVNSVETQAKTLRNNKSTNQIQLGIVLAHM